MPVTISNRIRKRACDLYATYTIRALLLSGYTPSKDHVTTNQLTGEISGNGYARATVTGPLSSQDDANDLGVLDCNDIPFGNVGPPGGQTVTHLGLVRRLGAVDDDAQDEIIGVWDANSTINGDVFVVAVNSSGLLAVA